MHFHSYELTNEKDKRYKLKLNKRYSTDSEGISVLLGLQAEANVELEKILITLEPKINDRTLFTL